ncbi:hypothetical protein D0T12_16850 [Actinomadura spongiicola]|uniref:Uncharacterized protein n=1 Tax=Actinomadura spongiicola TaxID=2303421 RepID=A0A372GFL8_9ACTN|nr:hypothetical protein [Actinomadura spongiicola]RFS83879.1 hypothetical protein D0T12_16850 [Actinomadura spongiicola]
MAPILGKHPRPDFSDRPDLNDRGDRAGTPTPDPTPDHDHDHGRRFAAGRAARGRLPLVALAWVAAYGALRVHWASGHQPDDLSPVGTDLVAFTGWAAAALCGAAAVILAALAVPRADTLGPLPRRALSAAAWTAAVCLVASGALLLLDVIGAVLPGLGVRFYPLGALSRAACVTGGILTGLSARAHTRRTRPGCIRCGRRRGAAGPLARTPAWAFWAAYLAVAGCLTRVAAQAVVGFDRSPLSGGPSAVLFEAGFLLGGCLLPPALVHSFGRTWPRFVPALRGRRVPRPLVLWPGTAISGGLTVYFGLMLLQMIWERLHGRNPFPAEGGLDLPESFFWVAVPAYLLWGAGMAVAAHAYARRTRVPCPSCGH